MAGERGISERLGRHLLLAGQPDSAVDFLLSGARERRETSDYGPAQALLAMRDDALQSLAAGRRDPRWGEGWVLRARIHLHQGQLDEVFRWAGRAVTGGAESDWNRIRSEALRLLGDAARRRSLLASAGGLQRWLLGGMGLDALVHEVVVRPVIDIADFAQGAQPPRPDERGIAAAEMLEFFERYDEGKYGTDGGPLHDPCVIAYLLKPDLFKGRHCNVTVETASELTMGMTVVDWWRVTDRPKNARVLRDMDARGFFDLLTERVGRL